mmetsp:Transcript_25212/g.28733  ORF Transcript_25212/g.28733 Transcript_25212/m.28733 type:complete len:273 (-) Transcript_25212:1787-2605(-)
MTLKYSAVLNLPSVRMDGGRDTREGGGSCSFAFLKDDLLLGTTGTSPIGAKISAVLPRPANVNADGFFIIGLDKEGLFMVTDSCCSSCSCRSISQMSSVSDLPVCAIVTGFELGSIMFDNISSVSDRFDCVNGDGLDVDCIISRAILSIVPVRPPFVNSSGLAAIVSLSTIVPSGPSNALDILSDRIPKSNAVGLLSELDTVDGAYCSLRRLDVEELFRFSVARLTARPGCKSLLVSESSFRFDVVRLTIPGRGNSELDCLLGKLSLPLLDG